MKKLSIEFDNITISSMSGNAGVFTGRNAQSNWQVNLKSNSGLGKMVGYQNIASHNVNIVNDNDVIDSDFSQDNLQYNQPVSQS
ncbi:hypothetical protein [Metabacillus iocasae]|uniref:Uncharacterized protein n=1 Tax=Priestia iocasae TaxID=2291674 RepID=A0ABS2QVB8_9BACI|nr:hypothetical protein [Metabacillus iocasae]MBM7703431.1 hypothetical protein [Metabacillus iocasae]